MEKQKENEKEKEQIQRLKEGKSAMPQHHHNEEEGGLPGGNDEGAPHGSRGDNKKHPHNTQDYGSRTNKK
jgi:hypothetical protein